jgi:ribonuclease HI
MAIITSPTGIKYRYAVPLSFALESDRCTNNIAEYEAVILGLHKLRASASPHASSEQISRSSLVRSKMSTQQRSLC